MSDEQQLVWHYTILPKIKLIQADPVLRPYGRLGQTPAVWFSTEQLWEPTATCNWEATLRSGETQLLDMDGLFKAHGGLYRIRVSPETAPILWEDYRAMINDDLAVAMLDGASELKAD